MYNRRGNEITIGTHAGKTVDEIVLKNADYTHWVLTQKATGTLQTIQDEMLRLIAAFDAKLFQKTCHDCKKPAACVSAYFNNPEMLYLWCDDCDPYSAGANLGKLTVLHSCK